MDRYPLRIVSSSSVVACSARNTGKNTSWNAGSRPHAAMRASIQVCTMSGNQPSVRYAYANPPAFAHSVNGSAMRTPSG